MAEEHPDLTCFLGDYIYEYSYTGARAKEIVGNISYKPDLMTLGDYRNRSGPA